MRDLPLEAVSLRILATAGFDRFLLRFVDFFPLSAFTASACDVVAFTLPSLLLPLAGAGYSGKEAPCGDTAGVGAIICWNGCA